MRLQLQTTHSIRVDLRTFHLGLVPGDSYELPGKVVVGLVPVKPEKGPLFPDYDCRNVARGLLVAFAASCSGLPQPVSVVCRFWWRPHDPAIPLHN